MKLTINSDESLSRAIGTLRDEYRDHRYLQVQVKTGQSRSLSQNAISHCWYEQVSRELREDTAEGVKAECKLRFGVPILRAEDDDFRAMYDGAIKQTMSYEQKLSAMKYLPVTSLMSKDQLSRYLEAIQAEFAQRGVQLEFPQEEMA